MKRALALLAMAASPASADALLQMDYENFYKTQTGAAEIVLKFTNNGATSVSFVKADCALLGADGKALTVVMVIAQNIAPGAHAYAKNTGGRDLPVKQADCRVVAVDR